MASDETYSFRHETILESILCSYAEEAEWQEILLNYAVDNVVIEFLRSSGYHSRPGEICVRLNDNLKEQFIAKLLFIFQSYDARSMRFVDPKIPPEVYVVEHPTFDDETLSNIIFKIIENKGIFKDESAMKTLFMISCEFGRLWLVNKLLHSYGKHWKSTKSNFQDDYLLTGFGRSAGNINDVKILEILYQYDNRILTGEVNHKGIILFALKCARKRCVEYLLEKNVDLNIKDCEGNTILHYCVFTHNWQDIWFYIVSKNPGLLKMQNINGLTPLMHAASLSNLELVRYLLPYEKNLSLQSKNGYTILHYCASKNWTSLCEEIVNLNIDLLNVTNKEGITPWMEMIDKDTLKTLLRYKPNSSIISRYNANILHFAVYTDCPGICEDILSIHREFLDAQNNLGETPIMRAAILGAENSLSYLLRVGANLNISNKWGYSLLHKCAEKNVTSMCEQILKIEPTLLESRTHFGETPLHSAVKNSSFEFVKCLIALKANIKHVDNEKNNVLHDCPNLAICNYIINLDKTLIYQTNNLDLTPIMSAVRKGYDKCVRCILDTDLSLIILRSTTLLHLASEQDLPKVCMAILEKDKKVLNMTMERSGMTPIIYAAHNGSKQCIQLFLEHGASLKIRDKFNNTILHYCAKDYLLDICSELLKLDNTLINAQNLKGETPLMFTLGNKSYPNCTKALQFLLQQKPDLSLTDRLGNTLFHHCAKHKSLYSMTDIYDMLLKLDKSLLEKQNVSNQTPILTAAINKSYETVQYCIAKKANLKVIDSKHNTVIHYLACLMDFLQSVGMLLDKSSYTIREIISKEPTLLNAQNIEGMTPILMAAKSRNYCVLKCLFSLGADVTIRDNKKITLLQYCYRYTPHIVSCLIKKHTKFNMIMWIADIHDRFLSKHERN